MSKPCFVALIRQLGVCFSLLGLIACKEAIAPPKNPLAANKAEAPTALQETSGQSIVFASLSGTPPRFIDSGPNRGMGWLEYETQTVRKGLAEDGFKIQREWFTPARIAHEFRSGNPICTFPFEWSDPQKTFLSKPDRLFSISLDLLDEGSHSIIIRQQDHPRFKRHLDQNGDLKLNQLLEDRTLKTLLVRDKDYGPVSKKVTFIDANGEQQIRPAFKTHVSLLVTKDNRQLIEMLNAGRFDYTFSDVIEAQDLKVSKLDQSKFRHINYRTVSLTGINDPKLVRMSIACSIHPTTLLALPYINKWIAATRGLEWKERMLKYQIRIDPKALNSNDDFYETTYGRFINSASAGEVDSWYPLQAKYFPGLRLFPAPTPTATLAPTEVPRRNPGRTPVWVAKLVRHRHLLLFHLADQGVIQEDGRGTHWDTFDPRLISQYLPSEIYQAMTRSDSGQTVGSSASFGELGLNSLPELQSLTVFAAGLTKKDIGSLAPLLNQNSLQELRFFHGGPQETAELVKNLPRSLTYLNLTNSSTSLSDLPDRIKGLPLRHLHLNSSQVTHSQAVKLISNLNENVESVSLGYHRRGWERSALLAFSNKKWMKLTYLDLENNFFTDADAFLLGEGLPPNLRVLKFGLNYLSKEGSKRLLHRTQNLEELDLSGSQPAQIPPSVKKLKLASCFLTSFDLSTKKLTELDLSGNPITPGGLQRLLPLLAPQMELLGLAEAKLSEEHLRIFTSGLQVKSIRKLDLSGNNLNDKALEILSRSDLQIQDLQLSDNLITNWGAAIIAQSWATGLRALNLSNNLISTEGLLALLPALSPQLKELKLSGLVEVNLKTLAPVFPRNLQQLDLSDSQLSDRDLQALGPLLPVSLSSLNLSGSLFGVEGARALAQHMPQKLVRLTLKNTPLLDQGFQLLAANLPASLDELELENLATTQALARSFIENMPKRLSKISLGIQFKAGEFENLLGELPQSLEYFGMISMPLSMAEGKAMSHHPSPSLRKLSLNQIATQDSTTAEVFKELPQTLEYLLAFEVPLGDQSLRTFVSQPFENLFGLEFSRAHFSELGLKAVEARPRWLRTLCLLNCRLNDRAIAALGENSLTSVRDFWLRGDPISTHAILQLLPKLHPDLVLLYMPSLGLKAPGVGPFIKALPKKIRALTLTGNPIGQVGIDRLRTYRDHQVQEEGIPLILRD